MSASGRLPGDAPDPSAQRDEARAAREITAIRPHPSRSLLILAIAALAFALGQTTLIPAFPVLITDLHTDASGAAWTLTGYLVSAAVFTPVMGRLGDMFGKRRMLVLSLCAFVGAVVSALGSSLEIVVAGRVLQGIGGGVFPLCFGIIRDEFPPDRVGRSIGLLSALAGVGGGLGMIVGGLWSTTPRITGSSGSARSWARRRSS